MKNKKFWKWQNSADPGGERVLVLNGTIASESWFEDDVTPKLFHEELFAGNGPVTIWLNSPGGDCIAASQIYTMLMDYKGDVAIKIDGIAASAASVIAMAGTKVLMAPTSLMMVHNPMTMAYGNYQDMEKAIDMLNEVKESILNAYEIRTGLSRAKLSHLMDDETWMNAGKAIELGFADGILTDEKREAAAASYAFSVKESERCFFNLLENAYGKTEESGNGKNDASDPEEVILKQEVGQEDETQEKVQKEEAQEELGTPIAELEKRLQLIKP